jgi:type IV secretory pathway protease TraF
VSRLFLNRVSQVRILPRFERKQLTEPEVFLLAQDVCVVVESPQTRALAADRRGELGVSLLPRCPHVG